MDKDFRRIPVERSENRKQAPAPSKRRFVNDPMNMKNQKLRLKQFVRDPVKYIQNHSNKQRQFRGFGFISSMIILGLIISAFPSNSTYAVAVEVQDATAGDTGQTELTLSFTNTPVENNVLIAVLFSLGADAPSAGTLPTGWSKAVEINDTTTNDWLGIYYKVAGANEPTDHTFAGLDTDDHGVWGGEFTNLDTADLLDKTASTSRVDSTTISSGTTAATAQANELAIAGYSSRADVSSSSYSNSFTETGNGGQVNGGIDAEVFVASKDLTSTGTQSSTLTKGSTSVSMGVIATFKVVDTHWYSPDWGYRIKITVLATEVDENVVDFPVYVDLNDLVSTFHDNVRSDGGDIRVTKGDGVTELPREIVDIDTGTANSGELHFKADALSSTSNTDFYIYYGNSTATDYATDATFGAENTWSSNYAAVYHMEEDPSVPTDGDCGASGGITQVQKKSAIASSGTSFSATFDSSPTAGNHIIAVVHAGDATVSTAPTGFTLVQEDSAGGGYTGLVYVKQAGASESSTVSITMSSSNEGAIFIYEYSGLRDVADPSEDGDWNYQGSGTTSVTTIGSNNSQADMLAVAATHFWSSDQTISYNNSFVEEFELHSGSNFNAGSATKIISSVETTGVTATWGTSTDGSSILATFLSTPYVCDSTSNDNDAVSHGSMTSGDSVSGKIGQGIEFDGSGDYLSAPDSSSLDISSDITTTLWMDIVSASAQDYLLNKDDYNVTDAGYGVSTWSGDMAVFIDGTTWAKYASPVNAAMHQFSFTKNGTDAETYKDGSTFNSYTDAPTSISTNTKSLHIGANDSGNYTFEGILDEIRILNVGVSDNFISTQYSNMNAPSSFYTDGAQEALPATSWYNASWLYRMKITVDSDEVDVDVVNFPVYVDLNDLGADFHDNVKSDGGDIRMTLADGDTEIPRELVAIDTGAANSGELHFRANYLSSTTDTYFYIYYGNSGASDYADTASHGAQNVWINGYEAVYHLEGVYTDSTANDYDGTNNGSTADSTGQLGAARSFDGDNDSIDVSNTAVFNAEGTYTLSAWIDPNNCGESGNGSIVVKDAVADFYICEGTNTYDIWDTTAADSASSNSSVVTTGAWDYAVVTFDGTDTYSFYDDGAGAGTDTPTWAPPTDGSGSINIGADTEGPSSSYVFDGDIDEVRIAQTARSAEWIATEYSNQNAPGTFITAGTQESNGPPMPLITQEGYIFENEDGTITSSGELADWYNSSWSYRKKITIESSEVDATLTNFPVYVDLNDLGSDFHNNVKSDGGDIRVTQSDGETEVPREVVDIDTGTADSGELHFRATSLSSTADTDFYIYYGNSGATEPATSATYGAENVWSNGYNGVWHLNKDCSDSTADCVVDSTGNGNDMTSYNFSTGGDNDVAGKLGRADDFDGTDSYHNLDSSNSSLAVGDDYTVTAWVNADSISSNNGIFTTNYDTDLHLRIWATTGRVAGMGYSANSGDWPYYDTEASTETISTSAGWEHIAFAIDTETSYALYREGSEVTTYSQTPDTCTYLQTLPKPCHPQDGDTNDIGGIGLYRDFDVPNSPSNVFDGQIDEVRLNDNELTADWIDAEYTNQDTPDTFYTIGTQTDRLSGVGFSESYTALAGSEFTTGKTMSNVSVGQRMNLRMHLTNEGAAIDSTDELALFYDRSDGLWSKVEQGTMPYATAGSGCGTGASTDFSCEEVFNGDGTTDGRYSDIAVGSDGRIWIAFWELNTTGNDGAVIVAQYVGDGLGNCDSFVGAGSDAWNCERVYDGDNSFDAVRLSMTTAPDGTPWLSFRNNTTYSRITVAEYVGDGAGDCDTVGTAEGSDNWDCTEVWQSDSGGDANYTDIVIDSTGKPWVSWRDGDTNDGKLWVASYEGTAGQDCDGLSETTGGSDYWDCTLVFDGDETNDGIRNRLAMGPDDTPWLLFLDFESTLGDITVAEYVGSGGDCNTVGDSGGSSAWDCTKVYEGDGVNDGNDVPAITIASDGNPWIAFRNASTGDEDLIVAKYVGTAGQDCDSIGGALGSDLWDCEVVFDDALKVGESTSIAEGPGGAIWVSFSNENTNDGKVYLAHYLGDASGNCDTLGSSGGSDDWQCIEAYDGTLTTAGIYNSLAFDAIGRPWVSFYVPATNDGQLWVSHFERQGEIVLSPGIYSSSGDVLDTSHADMTSATDTTGAGDADCLAASTTWNDGSWVGAVENATTLSVSKGDTTAQCSEIAWTIDTSQATPGETYRFVVASKDSFRPDKNIWRGPISVATDGYPTMTMADDNEIRYAKDNQATFADCTDTDWGCEQIESGATVGLDISIAMSPEGIPWVSYYDGITDDLTVATYVGSGGTGCTSTKWDCVDVDTTGDVGSDTSIIFDQNGTAWVSYQDNGTADSLKVAKYVGSGGTGCAVTSWTCTTVISASGYFGEDSDIAIDMDNNPWITHYDVTGDDLELARYVGGGNGTGCADSDWTCETIDSTGDIGRVSQLAFSPEGVPWVAYRYVNSGDEDLYAARYVGSGGTGCDTTAWNCEAVDTTNRVATTNIDISFNADGDAIIAYDLLTSANDLLTATYVGSGGDCDSTRGGSDAWECATISTSGEQGHGSAIANDSDGNPWIASRSGSNYLLVSRYVGSGGSCVDTAWDGCTNVNSIDPRHNSMAFDNSGTPWIASYDWDAGGAWITKLHLSPNKPTTSAPLTAGHRNAGTGDARYRLDPGTAPYSKDDQGSCGSTAGAAGYCGIFHDEGYFDSMYAGVNEKVLYTFSKRFPSNTEMPSATAFFQTDLAPSSSSVVLQVYRHGTTDTWETLTIDSTSSNCSTASCQIDGTPTGALSEYFEADGSDYWTHFRIYQNDSASTGFTFEFDSFRAIQTRSMLRHGAGFSDNLITPLGY